MKFIDVFLSKLNKEQKAVIEDAFENDEMIVCSGEQILTETQYNELIEKPKGVYCFRKYYQEGLNFEPFSNAPNDKNVQLGEFELLNNIE